VLDDEYSPPASFWAWKPPPNPKPNFEPNPGLLRKRIRQAPPPTEDQLRALRYARGIYQRALILGLIAWSDYGLFQKAKKFKRRYAISRANLLERLEAAGVAYLSRVGPSAEYHLVYGQPRSDMKKVMEKYHHVWTKKNPKFDK
jgi:hypothetical protein